MALTEHLHILISPELRQRLEERAKAEGKSVGALVRDLTEQGLLRTSREDLIRLTEQMLKLELPVGSVQEMKEEALRGALKL